MDSKTGKTVRCGRETLDISSLVDLIADGMAEDMDRYIDDAIFGYIRSCAIEGTSNGNDYLNVVDALHLLRDAFRDIKAVPADDE